MLYRVDKKKLLKLRKHRVPCNVMSSIGREQFEEGRERERDRARKQVEGGGD
jgi:hypothetical protein